MNKSTDSVRIVLFAKDDLSTFLILCEADDPTNWKLPGGKFEGETETPDAAASRELLEELGLKSEDVGLAKAGELINDDGVSARYIYRGVVDPEAVRPSVEISSIRWATTETVPESKNKEHMLSAVAAACGAS